MECKHDWEDIVDLPVMQLGNMETGEIEYVVPSLQQCSKCKKIRINNK